MERAERVALVIFFFGVGLTMVAAAGPLAFPGTPVIVWRAILFVGGLLALLSGALLVYEYRHLAKSPRMIPMFGMVVFGLGFLICSVWYFWPSSSDGAGKDNPQTLEAFFKTDFADDLILSRDSNVKYIDAKTNFNVGIKQSIYIDVKGNSSFVGFYIPNTPYTTNIMLSMVGEMKQIYQSLLKTVSAKWGYITDPIPGSTDQLVFTKTIYLYHETSLSLAELNQIEETYKQYGFTVHFRGPSYLLSRLSHIKR